MENQANSQLKQSMVYGGIVGLATIVISVIAFMLGKADNRSIQWINYLVEVILIVIGVKNYRDQHLGGYISYGKALGTGFLIGLVGMIIGLIYFYIFVNYIDTDFIPHLLEKSQEEMSNRGMSDEQIEVAMKYQQKFMTPVWMIVFASLAGALMNLIFSAIIAIFLKKNNESFDANFPQ